ncbi:acidic mammalian chitinase isoform X2, partial [Brachionus plicatilis]
DLKFKFSTKHIIGIVMSPLNERIQSYNLLEINNLVDYVNVEAFDYYGPWNKKTGLMSPLGKMNEQILLEAYMNIEGTMGYLKSLGLSMEKIVLGLAAYSRSFTLQHPMANRINDLTSGNGFSGSFTKTNGMLSYYELCEATKHGQWTEKWHPLAQVPFMYHQTEWISYENKESLSKKIEFVKTNNLAGACVYSIDLDDFRGLFCKKGPYPFLKMSLGLLATWFRKPKKDTIQISPPNEGLNNATEPEFRTKISIWNESRSKMLKKMTLSLNFNSSDEKSEKKHESTPRISFILITPRAIEKKSITYKRESKKIEEKKNGKMPTATFEAPKTNEISLTKKTSPLIDRPKQGPIISILNTFASAEKDEVDMSPVALKLISDSVQTFHSEKSFQNQNGLKNMTAGAKKKCDGKANGIYREENDCSAFYVCENKAQQELHEFRCPDGLIFSMRDCTCDWPQIHSPCIIPLLETLCKATDIKENNENEVFTKAIVSFNPTTTNPTTKLILLSTMVTQQFQQEFKKNEIFTCSNKQQGTYPDPYDCTKFYYCQPMSNIAKILAHEFKCPHGLHFNVNICRCDWPVNKNCKIPNHISYPCW